ncbi:hypothetical protein OVY35_24615, partial [Salmonella enterica subsp. enterica serovar 1,4,[5],12:i:-]|nr:hypothetical protein [Salmonella enterica subsp. enterica serovar 1,4,[5],12:i:-]
VHKTRNEEKKMDRFMSLNDPDICNGSHMSEIICEGAMIHLTGHSLTRNNLWQVVTKRPFYSQKQTKWVEATGSTFKRIQRPKPPPFHCS